MTPIATINLAQCQSAAAVIFAYGSNGLRYASPSAYFMFHEYLMGYGEAKGCDIQAIQKHTSKIDKMINKKLETHIGLKPGFFENLGHVDTYMTAQDAKKHSIVNHIGYPTLRLEISLSSSLQLKTGKRQEIPNPEHRPYKYRKFLTEAIQITEIDEDD